jgi:hypothetical protein
VLVSGLVVAEASGRRFRMIWPRTPACGARFGELFSNDWPVIDVEELDPTWHALWLRSQSVRNRPDAVSDPRPELAIASSWWLLPLEEPARAAERMHCVERLVQLQPIPLIRERVAEFQARHFRPTMIGVHLRRGDFVRHRPDQVGNTLAAQTALERFLAEAPDAGILLCTDDSDSDHEGRSIHRERVRELFVARYGARMVPSPARRLDRQTVEGAQDALVDLLLLRATQFVVGTAASTFSQLAVFGRPVPRALVAGDTPQYRRRLRRARLTGAYWIVLGLARVVYGERLAFPLASRRLTALKARLRTRIRDVVRRR